jgi:hypothetical protein
MMYNHFDWIRAAERIKEVQPQRAVAGLHDDMFWTSDCIYKDGEPQMDAMCYLTSYHAVPCLVLDGVSEECYKDGHQDPKLLWPDEALEVLRGPHS